MPRIVLPVTSRGLVITDRLCWGILGAAMALAAGLILYLNRGTTFFLDELVLLADSPTLGADDVLEPYNGHLIATHRLLYKAILETIGPSYLPFRLVGASAVLLAGGLFFALAKRRIGALPALAPTLVLLFFGSADWYVGTPLGLTPLLSIIAGLGALLALERGDLVGDAAACALLAFSVASFSIGLAFLVGVAISVLMRPDRRQRAWIFLLPLALYAAWYLWAADSLHSPENSTKLSNALLFPSYAADALAAATGALAGLDYDFAAGRSDVLPLGWGRVLAVIAVVALIVRIRRGSVPPSLWVSLGIALTLWASGALAAQPGRTPDSARFVYAGAVVVLLVATDAARSIRFSRLGLAALFGVCAVSLATNVALLRDFGAHFRDAYSGPLRAQFAMLELSRGRVSPDYAPSAHREEIESPVPLPGGRTGAYLRVVDRYGSLGLPLSELERKSEAVRGVADRTLASALRLHLERARIGGSAGCSEHRSREPGGPISFELPRGGASLRARGGAPSPVSLGRFASSPSAEVGTLAPGEGAVLELPRDSSPRPWIGSIAGASSVEVCAVSRGAIRG